MRLTFMPLQQTATQERRWYIGYDTLQEHSRDNLLSLSTKNNYLSKEASYGLPC